MKRKYRLKVLLPSAVVLTGFIVLLCLCLGSVPIALNETFDVLCGALTGAVRDDYIAVILLKPVIKALQHLRSNPVVAVHEGNVFPSRNFHTGVSCI